MAVTGFSLRQLNEVLPDRFAEWVQWACILTIAGYGVLVGLDLSGVRAQGGLGIVGEAVALAVACVALLLKYRGLAAYAALLLVLGVGMELHWAIFLDGDLSRGGALVVPVLVLAGGALLGGYGPFLLAGSAMVTLPLAVYLGGVRRGDGLGALEAQFGAFVVMSLALIAMAVLLHHAIRAFESVLALADQRARRVADLIAYSPDAILVVDGEGKVTRVNPAAEQLFLRPRDWFLGRSVHELGLVRPPADLDDGMHLDALAHVLDGTAGTPVLLGVATPEGRHGRPRRIIEATSRSVGNDGPARRLHVSLRDVTGRVRDEAERREVEQRLQHANRLQAVAALAGGIAHDFNNMLTVVRGAADLLQGDDDEEMKSLGKDLQTVQERGANLTRKLLTFARRDAAEPSVVVLSAVVRDAEVFLRSVLGDAARLEVALDDEGTVLADPDQLDQVLAHLVTNARDAGASRVQITVRAAPDDRGALLLGVEDDGEGMGPRTRDRMFDPFFSTRGMGQGVGLGLSTVLGIVQSLDGTIEVETHPGRGTRIDVRIPRHSPD